MFVCGVIVDDDVNCQFGGRSGVNNVEEANELLMAMAHHALANDLAFEDVEGEGPGGLEPPTRPNLLRWALLVPKLGILRRLCAQHFTPVDTRSECGRLTISLMVRALSTISRAGTPTAMRP